MADLLIDAELHQQLEEMADRRGITVAELVEELIERGLAVGDER